MPREKWINLSHQKQQAWDTISNRSKAIILGILSPYQDTKLNAKLKGTNGRVENIKLVNQSKSNFKISEKGSYQQKKIMINNPKWVKKGSPTS